MQKIERFVLWIVILSFTVTVDVSNTDRIFMVVALIAAYLLAYMERKRG
jgi:hypothetical protein